MRRPRSAHPAKRLRPSSTAPSAFPSIATPTTSKPPAARQSRPSPSEGGESLSPSIDEGADSSGSEQDEAMVAPCPACGTQQQVTGGVIKYHRYAATGLRGQRSASAVVSAQEGSTSRPRGAIDYQCRRGRACSARGGAPRSERPMNKSE